MDSQNCQNECESKIYLDNCNCTLYYLPRIYEDVTICGRSDSGCVDNLRKQISTIKNHRYDCDCLPGCFAISFDAEVSMAPLIPRYPLKKININTDNAAVIHVFYRENFFRSQRKEELIGFTEFLCKLF